MKHVMKSQKLFKTSTAKLQILLKQIEYESLCTQIKNFIAKKVVS